jgi:hypothetical protein
MSKLPLSHKFQFLLRIKIGTISTDKAVGGKVWYRYFKVLIKQMPGGAEETRDKSRY